MNLFLLPNSNSSFTTQFSINVKHVESSSAFMIQRKFSTSTFHFGQTDCITKIVMQVIKANGFHPVAGNGETSLMSLKSLCCYIVTRYEQFTADAFEDAEAKTNSVVKCLGFYKFTSEKRKFTLTKMPSWYIVNRVLRCIHFGLIYFSMSLAPNIFPHVPHISHIFFMI